MLQYVYGKGDVESFWGTYLRILKIENSIFTLKYSLNVNRWVEIQCKSFDQEDEIEFSECVLSAQGTENSPVIEEPIGYKFKFNKNTKYEFKLHYIFLKHDDNSLEKVRFRIYALIITFPGYTKKYSFNNERLTNISAYFTGTTVVEDFERYGGTLSDEMDPSVPVKTDKTEGDTSDEMKGDTSDEVNGDTTDQINGDFSDETDRDKSDQIKEKKVFWTTKTILAIVLSTVAFTISVLVIALIIRYR
ncbi:hypothetical protein RF11_06018 [Thelohanellus kitauei]|uniref:Uncharacterized protein n=1 Tax=Thelohanellus kitauei TaxID=669202 RepID=A0A0C2NA02_THEKT|nr:hypothetical protein RF11_06018 [Thelohanellus kitauei]